MADIAALKAAEGGLAGARSSGDDDNQGVRHGVHLFFLMPNNAFGAL